MDSGLQLSIALGIFTFLTLRHKGKNQTVHLNVLMDKSITLNGEFGFESGESYFDPTKPFVLDGTRQHWFISRLHGASVTAGGFAPKNSNVLVICTSSNQVYVFDVEAKQLGEWSKHNTFLPRRFQEFPGEVIGLTFPPSHSSSSVMIYSSRAMCLIDFGVPVAKDDEMMIALDALSKKSVDPSIIPTMKRKRKQFDPNHLNLAKRNFEFKLFKDPVLFVGYVSENSLLVVEKPWLDVVQKMEAPQHRHIFGT